MNELKIKRDNLATLYSYLSARDCTFAQSLVRYFDNNGAWSEKQLYWVDTLTKLAESAKVPPQQTLPLSEHTDPVPQPVQNLIRISQLFEKALAQGLKYPKIRLEASDGTKVVLRYASANSRMPGSINITNAANYGPERSFYGRIDLQGIFKQSWACTPAVLQLINDLAKDPVGLAKLYGLKTSTCCFCALPLKTSESVTMGYGPICAQKFGLPWGETKETTYTCLTLENEDAKSHAAN